MSPSLFTLSYSVKRETGSDLLRYDCLIERSLYCPLGVNIYHFTNNTVGPKVIKFWTSTLTLTLKPQIDKHF